LKNEPEFSMEQVMCQFPKMVPFLKHYSLNLDYWMMIRTLWGIEIVVHTSIKHPSMDFQQEVKNSGQLLLFRVMA
jgi:hypothetical protein